MSTFVKLKSLKESFSASEQKLANFVLNSSNAIRELSSQELANVAGVSQSSVVKFTQKLGYKGYPAFKLAIIDSLNSESNNTQLHGNITLNTALPQVANILLNSKTSVLNETNSLNDDSVLSSAIELILSSKRILICGIGGSALVGKDFAYKLQKLGITAFAESDPHAQLAHIATFGQNDLIFSISESGSTREVIEVTDQAKSNATKVITLTKFAKNAVSKNADVNLYSVAENEEVRLSSILARTSQEFVIDVLFIGLTQASKAGRKQLQITNSIVNNYRNP